MDTSILYYTGIYRITPMGEHTAFECLVQLGTGSRYFLMDEDGESLSVSREELDRMRPQFLRLWWWVDKRPLSWS